MKTLNEIRKAIKANANKREDANRQIYELDRKAEKAAAAKAKNHDEYIRVAKEAEANAEKIAKLSDELYILNIENLVLQENARAALFAEAYPIILKACEKYNGKPYGEKTREKIYQEVKKAGYSFYFDGYEDYRINISEITPNYYGGYKTTANATDENGKYSIFVTKDNKLNIANVTASPNDKYTENPRKKARQIAKAIKAHEKALDNARKTASELSSILPDGIPRPEYIKSYYVRF
jgi:hypothetical protein